MDFSNPFIIGIVVVAAIWLVLVIIISSAITKLSGIKIFEVPSSEQDATLRKLEGHYSENWLQQKQFARDGVFSFSHGSDLDCAASWWSEKHQSLFLLLRSSDKKVHAYFNTCFEDFSVKTTSNRTEHVIPARPSLKLQSFTVSDNDELFDRHSDALQECNGVPFSTDEARSKFLQLFQLDTLEQVAHLYTIPLWPVKTPFWLLYRPLAMHNKRIAS